MVRSSSLLILSVVAALSTAAQAADFPSTGFPDAPPLDVPEQAVEFGTGWYLRGDAGFVDRQALKATYAGTAKQTVALGQGWAGTVGAGYKFTSWLRSDLTLDYSQYQGNINAVSSEGVCAATGCALHARSNLMSGALLINGYVDLGTWYGITPYVGAGVGVARNSYKSGTTTVTDATFGGVYGIVPPTSVAANRFAWAAMAGVSVDVAPHVALDLGYRYANFGAYSIGPGAAVQGGGTLPLGNAKTTDVTSHEFRAGVRYMVD